LTCGRRGARVGARVGIGVAVYVQLAVARGAWAQERLPVPWPTRPGEVIPYAPAGTPKAPEKGKAAGTRTQPPAQAPTQAPVQPQAPVQRQAPAQPTPVPAPVQPQIPVQPTLAPSTPTPASTSAPVKSETHLGAIGEGVVFIDRSHDAEWDPVRRLMATLTHSPTSWLRFHAEVGVEHATTFAAQQAVVEVTPAPELGFRAGLLLLPLGIINQNNAPPTFLTVDRPLTDQLIIPSIWREFGAGIFGDIAGGLRYELDVVGGLDGAGFSAQAPLAGGRGNGARIGSGGVALTGRAELHGLPEGFAMGASGYYGSASGGQAALDGVTVGIVEGDARFRGGGLELRAEFAQMFIFNSYRVNDYLGLLGQDAVSKAGRGSYVTAGYDLLRLGGAETRQELMVFAGYENVNPRSAMSPYNYNPPSITPAGETPPNAPSPPKSFVRGGIVYRPLPELAFKVDVQIALDGVGPPPMSPLTLMGAPGTPKPLESHLAEAARGKTRLGLAIGFAF
jgi:hypothetical protein